jgi:hypothetical protein
MPKSSVYELKLVKRLSTTALMARFNRALLSAYSSKLAPIPRKLLTISCNLLIKQQLGIVIAMEEGMQGLKGIPCRKQPQKGLPKSRLTSFDNVVMLLRNSIRFRMKSIARRLLTVQPGPYCIPKRLCFSPFFLGLNPLTPCSRLLCCSALTLLPVQHPSQLQSWLQHLISENWYHQLVTPTSTIHGNYAKHIPAIK